MKLLIIRIFYIYYFNFTLHYIQILYLLFLTDYQTYTLRYPRILLEYHPPAPIFSDITLIFFETLGIFFYSISEPKVIIEYVTHRSYIP